MFSKLRNFLHVIRYVGILNCLQVNTALKWLIWNDRLWNNATEFLMYNAVDVMSPGNYYIAPDFNPELSFWVPKLDGVNLFYILCLAESRFYMSTLYLFISIQ
jgi:hypothetical protein